MKPEKFVATLANMKFDAVFNPYADRCAVSDRREAPRIRRKNLTDYLYAAKGTVTSVWFGRDLGYRGGRRTGLALTDEYHLPAFSARYGGVSVLQATKGPPMIERTASIVWKMLYKLREPPFLWNVFPFHPHEPNDSLTNRCHTVKERRECIPMIEALLDWLQPTALIAIGNDAYKGLADLGYQPQYVRHPSYGGQAEFVRGISNLYELGAEPNAQERLF